MFTIGTTEILSRMMWRHALDPDVRPARPCVAEHRRRGPADCPAARRPGRPRMARASCGPPRTRLRPRGLHPDLRHAALDGVGDCAVRRRAWVDADRLD